MLYELFILSILMYFPTHAYQLSKIIEPWIHVSRGTLSTTLKKMLAKQVIVLANTETTSDNRQIQNYQITNYGKTYFFELMMDVSDQSNFIKLFHIKTNAFHLLKKQQRQFLIQEFISACIKRQEFLLKQVANLQTTDEPPQEMKYQHFSDLATASLKLEYQQLELEKSWAEKLEENHFGKYSK